MFLTMTRTLPHLTMPTRCQRADDRFMFEAVKEARAAIRTGDWPIGCIIALNDTVIARAHNLVYSNKNKLAHAEMLALQQLTPEHLRNADALTIYTTYEPCPMCAGALLLTKIGTIVYGVNPDASGASHLLTHPPLHFKAQRAPVVRAGVLSEQCYQVFVRGKPAIRRLRHQPNAFSQRDSYDRSCA